MLHAVWIGAMVWVATACNVARAQPKAADAYRIAVLRFLRQDEPAPALTFADFIQVPDGLIQPAGAAMVSHC